MWVVHVGGHAAQRWCMWVVTWLKVVHVGGHVDGASGWSCNVR